MTKTVVAFGELVWDIFSDGKILGGAPVNLAFRLNSFGETCFLLSRVGDDEAGKEALRQVKKLGRLYPPRR